MPCAFIPFCSSSRHNAFVMFGAECVCVHRMLIYNSKRTKPMHSRTGILECAHCIYTNKPNTSYEIFISVFYKYKCRAAIEYSREEREREKKTEILLRFISGIRLTDCTVLSCRCVRSISSDSQTVFMSSIS